MVFTTFILPLVLCSFAQATFLPLTATASAPVQWGPCALNSTVPIDCTNFTVPLDYTDPVSSDTLNLSLLRVPASKQPVKGNILFNFGGLGFGCNLRMTQLAETLQVITGGDYNLVTWDPRGTVETLTFSCYDSMEERLTAAMTNQGGGLGNTSDRVVTARNWAIENLRAQACVDRPESAERGSLIGNAFTARDAMQIADALEDDGLIRYWGLSYGTVLGATIAAIFPDRIEKMVIDAVMNPQEYYNAFDIELWADTDMVFGKFFEACLEAPEACLLARNHNGTASELEERAYRIIDQLKYRPIPYQKTILDSATVKHAIRPSLYSPARYPALGRFFDAFFDLDLERIFVGLEELRGLAPAGMVVGTGDDAPHGIHCADKTTRLDSLDEMFPIMDELESTSRLSGDLASLFPMACSQWKIVSKERYEGSWTNITTRNPMLVIGGSFDPATPFRSAVNVSAGFENSVLLEHGGFGHGSIAHPSLCTARTIQSYFRDGTLPPSGTLCPVDTSPFGNVTWTPLLPNLI